MSSAAADSATTTTMTRSHTDTPTASFTHLDRSDVRDLLRHHDMGKVYLIDTILEAAAAAGVSSTRLFHSLCAQYNIDALREEEEIMARERLRQSAAQLTQVEVESALRRMRVRKLCGDCEEDVAVCAKLVLRERGVHSRQSTTTETLSNPHTTAKKPTSAADATVTTTATGHTLPVLGTGSPVTMNEEVSYKVAVATDHTLTRADTSTDTMNKGSASPSMPAHPPVSSARPGQQLQSATAQKQQYVDPLSACSHRPAVSEMRDGLKPQQILCRADEEVPHKSVVRTSCALQVNKRVVVKTAPHMQPVKESRSDATAVSPVPTAVLRSSPAVRTPATTSGNDGSRNGNASTEADTSPSALLRSSSSNLAVPVVRKSSGMNAVPAPTAVMDEVAAEEVRDWLIALLPGCYTAALQQDKPSNSSDRDSSCATNMEQCSSHDESRDSIGSQNNKENSVRARVHAHADAILQNSNLPDKVKHTNNADKPTQRRECCAADNVTSHLRSGVLLCLLLQRLRQYAHGVSQAQHTDPAVAAPAIATSAKTATPVVLTMPRRWDGFYARDNVAHFLRTVQAEYGLGEAQLFCGSDLCDGRNSRRVITALLSLARVVHRRHPHAPMPALVRYESEIGALPRRSGEALAEERVREETLVEDDAEAGNKHGCALSCAADAAADSASDVVHVKVNGTSAEVPTKAMAQPVATAFCAIQSAAHIVEDGSTRNSKKEWGDDNALPCNMCDDESADPIATTRDNTALSTDDGHDVASTGTVGGVSLCTGEADMSTDVCITPSPARTAVAGTHGMIRPCCVEAKINNGNMNSESMNAVLRHPHGIVKSAPATVATVIPDVGQTSRLAAPHYVCQHWDSIDVAVGEVLNTYYRCHRRSLWRVRALRARAGEYVLYHRLNSQRMLVHARVIQGRVLVSGAANVHRTQKWMELRAVLEQIDSV